MREIKLNTVNKSKNQQLGLVAMVDDEDYDYLMQWKWYAEKGGQTFYAVSGFIKRIRMHRIILNVNSPKIFVDHKNRNGLDNRRHNLRLCSPTQNTYNKPKKLNTASKYYGVTKHKSYWRSSIVVDGKRISLGLYKNEVEAALAYNAAALKYRGEFAAINNIL